ncbi:aspartate beta-hydroxylase [Undibacterium sp. GrIS 1.2]|uniref:aspartyl/asparaginyl beta-hydroxylase domain-containing protein n=1 Tax=Undibacterium sp. GrIS 1.2 TaxID=3143933 RepID=UPI0033933371
METTRAILKEIEVLTALAKNAIQAGNEQEALKFWSAILQMSPNHVLTLSELGKHALKRGEFKSALIAFQRIVSIDSSNLQSWISLAITYRQLKDEAAEERSIQQALIIDPSDLLALIMRADLLDRQGLHHQAVVAHVAVAKVAPPMEKLHPSLHPSVLHATKYKEDYDKKYAQFLDDYLAPFYKEFSDEKLHRFRDSIDILVGRKKRFDSQSVGFHYSSLAPIEFFEREEFPWLVKIEQETDQIRDEFLQILQAEKGFTPYLEYPQGLPLNQFAELNNSPNWSAFHLYKNGLLIEENTMKCPRTMELLSNVPQPIQLDKTPSAMFSLLKPFTKIPPHTGISNVRLVTHIPLIIPNDCGFRVGNQVRSWEPGKALIFDDTIEHEAWNNSNKLRVVLIFDIWHPHLSIAERALITAMSHGIKAFKN